MLEDTEGSETIEVATLTERATVATLRTPDAKTPASGRANTAARRAGPRAAPQALSEDERRRLIAETAYFLAESRGFIGGDPVEDWLQAEAEVERRFLRSA